MQKTKGGVRGGCGLRIATRRDIMASPVRKPAIRLVRDPSEAAGETAPRYLSRIQDLLSDPAQGVDESDAVTRLNRVPSGEPDGPSLSALVGVYADRVERRSTWLNAELLPAAKRERPIRHVLGPRPIPVLLQNWLDGLRWHSLRSTFARWSRDHGKLLRQVALLVVVAAASSLMTLLATRW